MPKPVFIIIRNGRRADNTLFKTRDEAYSSFLNLQSSLRLEGGLDNFKIIKTSAPFLFR